MQETKGHCKHGEFDLKTGCAQCIAEKRAEAEVNSPANIAKRVAEAQATKKPFIEQEIPTEYNLPIVKVQYYSETSGELSSRQYTYYSADQLVVGDIVTVPVRDTTGKARVSAVGVSESEIASFRDKVKTIPSGSIVPVVKPENEEMEEGLNAEGLTLRNVGEPVEITESLLEESAAEPKPEVVVSKGTAIVKVDPGAAPSFARHLESAKRMVEIAAAREIVTEVDAKAANDDLTVMGELRKAVDAERKTFTVPLNEYLGAINGAYKLITAPLLEAEQITRKALTAYKVEQKRKADETAKLNQDAIDLARRQAEANNGEFTVEIKPIPVLFAPKLTRTDQGTSGLVDNWKYRIVDLEKLPREYMIPDDAMLKSIAKSSHDKKQVAGVEFYNLPTLRVSR